MARKSNKQILQEQQEIRKQRAEEVLQNFLLSREFRDKRKEGIRKIKETIQDKTKHLELYNKLIWSLVGEHFGFDLSQLLPSNDIESMIEKGIGSDAFFDLKFSMAILKDDGTAVDIQGIDIDNSHLTIRINLAYPITTIEAEVKNIIEIFKKIPGVSKITKPMSPEELGIIIEQAKGSTQGNIIRKIRDQTAITNDGARARIKRAKKKSTK